MVPYCAGLRHDFSVWLPRGNDRMEQVVAKERDGSDLSFDAKQLDVFPTRNGLVKMIAIATRFDSTPWSARRFHSSHANASDQGGGFTPNCPMRARLRAQRPAAAKFERPAFGWEAQLVFC